MKLALILCRSNNRAKTVGIRAKAKESKGDEEKIDGLHASGSPGSAHRQGSDLLFVAIIVSNVYRRVPLRQISLIDIFD